MDADRTRRTRALSRIAVGAAVATSVVESARRARRCEVGPTEVRTFRWWNDLSDRIAVPAWSVMQSGSLGAVAVAAGVVGRTSGARRASIVGTVGAAVWIGAKAIKPLVGRGRPDAYLEDVAVRGSPQSGLGYPSGHSAVAVALALMLTASGGDRGRPLTRAMALSIAAGAGAARMYVGAHLPLDVVGGAALGVGAGTLGSAMLR